MKASLSLTGGLEESSRVAIRMQKKFWRSVRSLLLWIGIPILSMGGVFWAYMAERFSRNTFITLVYVPIMGIIAFLCFSGDIRKN